MTSAVTDGCRGADHLGGAGSNSGASADLAGAGGSEGNLRQRVAVAAHRDAAPVGQPRHHQLCEALQRVLVVQGRGQLLPGLRQQALGELGALDLGEVLDHAHDQRQRAVGVEHGSCLIQQPALLAGGADHVANEQRLGYLPASRARGRKVRELDDPPRLVEHVVESHQLPRCGVRHLAGRAEVQQPRRRRVREHDPPVRPPDEDRLREIRQRRLEPPLEPGHGLGQRGVVECERDTPGQDLGVAQVVLVVASVRGADAERERADCPPPCRSGTNRAERSSSARRSSKSSSLLAIIRSSSSVTLAISWLWALTIARGSPTGASGSGPPQQRGLELLAPSRGVDARPEPPQLAVRGDAVERRDVGERRHDQPEQPRHRVVEQRVPSATSPAAASSSNRSASGPVVNQHHRRRARSARRRTAGARSRIRLSRTAVGPCPAQGPRRSGVRRPRRVVAQR